MKHKFALIIIATTLSQNSLGANQTPKLNFPPTPSIATIIPRSITVPVVDLNLPILDAIDAVRLCAGLKEISSEEAAQLSYNKAAVQRCPELARLNKTLSGPDRCMAREIALAQGWTNPTWKELVYSGTGPYKYAKNRAEIPMLIKDPDKLALARTAWCIEHPRVHTTEK